jgi:hypothetical protein
MLALAFLFYYLQASGAARVADAWAADRVIAYALLFFGPLLIFLPFSVALRLGPVWLLGAGSWALLGYVLIFVGPPARGEASFFTYVAFLTLVFVALTSLLAIIAGGISRRFLPPAATSFLGMVRAIRQGGLLALFAVALLAMSPLGVLNWLNTLLVFTIVALTEFFFIARD